MFIRIPYKNTAKGAFIIYGKRDGWMNGVLGHFYALSRLNWARDNLG